ncbi:uncharacterized protein CC84DRAFT_123810 [Paraphaeosphaeria sporulosa]|uniref:Uncharacterized protein n=1 Tax=Paraphaeosphaeria sporulosa TaxID=1460663 RepID=A0A177CZS0_9PLEO|nr:uncharacterized protein CC84DRAFT_123810 [Paraphaeosphaeria sporulosa]OAG12467.1 hypothetical protein CC84DRAFT_123810 [Paraphaeosphaeria sporulosa]
MPAHEIIRAVSFVPSLCYTSKASHRAIGRSPPKTWQAFPRMLYRLSTLNHLLLHHNVVEKRTLPPHLPFLPTFLLTDSSNDPLRRTQCLARPTWNGSETSVCLVSLSPRHHLPHTSDGIAVMSLFGAAALMPFLWALLEALNLVKNAFFHSGYWMLIGAWVLLAYGVSFLDGLEALDESEDGEVDQEGEDDKHEE